MGIFTTDLVPEIIAIEKEYKRQVKLAVDELFEDVKAETMTKDFPHSMDMKLLDMVVRERMLRLKLTRRIEGELNYVHIFHRLEYLSIYINQKLVIDDVVYPGLNDTLLKFMNAHCELFYTVQEEEKCFKSLQNLYEEWIKRKLSENN